MINLLPPPLKEQVRYARMNRIVLRYLKLTALVVVVLAAVFAGADYLIRQQINSIASDTASKESQLAAERNSFLPEAEDANQRLSAIEYVQSTQTDFSGLISQIVSLMPVGVSLSGISLTGDSQQPVTLSISAQTYDEVLALRNSLTNDPNISAVDIVSITGKSTAWSGTLVIAFKPGKAQ